MMTRFKLAVIALLFLGVGGLTTLAPGEARPPRKPPKPVHRPAKVVKNAPIIKGYDAGFDKHLYRHPETGARICLSYDEARDLGLTTIDAIRPCQH